MSRISFPRSSGLYNGSGTMRKGFGMTVTLASAAQLLKLADARTLPPGRHGEALCRVLHDWYIAGWLHPGTDT